MRRGKVCGVFSEKLRIDTMWKQKHIKLTKSGCNAKKGVIVATACCTACRAFGSGGAAC